MKALSRVSVGLVALMAAAGCGGSSDGSAGAADTIPELDGISPTELSPDNGALGVKSGSCYAVVSQAKKLGTIQVNATWEAWSISPLSLRDSFQVVPTTDACPAGQAIVQYPEMKFDPSRVGAETTFSTARTIYRINVGATPVGLLSVNADRSLRWGNYGQSDYLNANAETLTFSRVEASSLRPGKTLRVLDSSPAGGNPGI